MRFELISLNYAFSVIPLYYIPKTENRSNFNIKGEMMGFEPTSGHLTVDRSN